MWAAVCTVYTKYVANYFFSLVAPGEKERKESIAKQSNGKEGSRERKERDGRCCPPILSTGTRCYKNSIEGGE